MESKSQPFDYLLVLDFEATCDNDKSFNVQEIIEFPVLMLNTRTLEIDAEFHYYLRPKVHPRLTQFCKELTGIQQQWVDNGITFDDALNRLHRWMIEHGLISAQGQPLKSFTFLTCGDWDLRSMLTKQCRREKIERPRYMTHWVNIKLVFEDFYRHKPMGMPGMLHHLRLQLKGRHHSGIDDCRNIVQVAKKMLQDGCIIDETTKERK